MTGIYKVMFINDGVTITRRDGGTCLKYSVTLRELGGKYDNQYVTTLFSDASCPLEEGDTVAASLRFMARDHEGQYYQDIILQEYVSLRTQVMLPRIP